MFFVIKYFGFFFFRGIWKFVLGWCFLLLVFIYIVNYILMFMIVRFNCLLMRMIFVVCFLKCFECDLNEFVDYKSIDWNYMVGNWLSVKL